MEKLKFLVDTRIATLLSQEYSSSERALKELVDNAWDADASLVSITLPEPMTDQPIVIEDNGSGMTGEELRRHYLVIASDRRARSGEKTAVKQRRVKGRKGIGKFAGLMVADDMTLETWSRGKRYILNIRLEDLQKAADIEHLPLPVVVEDCDPESSGSRITLSHLKQKLAFPTAMKMRQALIHEYGREDGFAITVSGKALDIDDLPGRFAEHSLSLPGVGAVELRFSISEQKSNVREPGISIRVDGKAIGKPQFFGLDAAEEFPQRLKSKLFGEIHVNGLRDHVTAGWDSVVENSEYLEEVRRAIAPILKAAFKEAYGREVQLAQARLSKSIHDRLSKLPEFKRQYADRAIRRVLARYYGEPESRAEPIVNVLLEALENADYRVLLEHINDVRGRDVSAIVEVIEEIGLAEIVIACERAKLRLAVLDQMEQLCADQSALEVSIHKAFEENLWILGPEYTLFSSNKTLRTQIKEHLDKRYVGALSDRRPDLVLNEGFGGKRLLIEFKRPAVRLGLEAYQQATGYRHELSRISGAEMEIIVLGGKFAEDLPSLDRREKDVKVLTYQDVIGAARSQLEWLLCRENM